MHIKQLKTCQGSKMETTGQSGQVGRPTPRSADQGQAELDSSQVGRPGGWLPDPLTGPKMHQVTDPQRQQSEGRAMWPMQG
ncbi:hypothetical protein U9M48_008956 [Paspalum notatum var. saurae]|uniref:Uncharacterized protein n=1 Tax=Paspalum notatum var. saurae TaxID=547442 RepID=A0AAQ3WE80_PASNO